MIGGIIYPTSVLPDFLNTFSSILPVKHIAELIREISTNGFNIENAQENLVSIFLLTILYNFVGIIVLRTSVYFSKKNNNI